MIDVTPTMADGWWVGRVVVPGVLLLAGGDEVSHRAQLGLLDDARMDIAAAGMVVDPGPDRLATMYLEPERLDSKDRVLRLEVPYVGRGVDGG